MATKGLKKARAAVTRDEGGSNMEATLEATVAQLKAQQAQLKAEQKKRAEIEALPPEVFVRARELRKKGKFERRIVNRAPKNLNWDMAEFECGHKTDILERSNDTTGECRECLEAWLRRHVKKAKRAPGQGDK